MIELFLLLLFGHALADYPLQGDFLAKAKNRTAPIPGFPWWHALGAHSVIHGGFVGVITGNWWLGLAEVVAHFLIDDAKCRGRIGINTDQALHVAFKALWVFIVAVSA